MKYYIVLILTLVCGVLSAQKLGVDVVKFQGNTTTAVRDAMDVPAGETWMIHNITTDQIEWASEDDVWTTISGVDWSDPVNADILSDVTETRTIGAAGNEFLGIYGKTLYAGNGSTATVIFRHNTGSTSLMGDVNGIAYGGDTLATKDYVQSLNAATAIPYDNATSGLTATDVQDAIDELDAFDDDIYQSVSNNASNIATLQAVPASTFGISEKTADYTLVAGDAIDTLLIKLTYDNEALTIPSGVFSEGQSIRILKSNDGANETRIIEGTGVSLVGYTDGVTLGTYPSGATIARTTSATAPEIWEVVDYYGSIADYTGSCTADANEYHTQANAASDPNCNEANGTTGWVSNGTNGSIGVEGTVVDTGLYSIKQTSAGTSDIVYTTYAIPGDVNGNTYTVTFSIRDNGAADARATQWINCTGGPNNVHATETWTEYTYNITSTGSASLRFYAYGGGGGGVAGDAIYVDNVSIVKTN